MAELNLAFDDSSFLAHTAALQAKLKLVKKEALRVIADEILRLSQLEVPFVTGELMASGVAQEDGDEYVVGYNKVYAAYMHEGVWADGSHEIQNYSNGRKGKYLEDPMKVNKEILTMYFGQTLKAGLGMV